MEWKDFILQPKGRVLFDMLYVLCYYVSVHDVKCIEYMSAAAAHHSTHYTAIRHTLTYNSIHVVHSQHSHTLSISFLENLAKAVALLFISLLTPAYGITFHYK